jgi:L-lysine 6-transaminase
MSSITRTHQLSPDAVVDILSRHILVDGYHVVMDLEKSRGSYLFDARSGRPILDFFSNFATCPIGYNHPGMQDPEFRERLLQVALVKPANSDIYTSDYADFVETFTRLALPPSHAGHVFFVEGGAAGVENALKTAFDWKVRGVSRAATARREGPHFREAFHGRTGYALSLTNTADARKTQYFPVLTGPASLSCRGSRDPDPARPPPPRGGRSEIRKACAESPGDIAAPILEPIRGSGDNHFRPELFRRLRASPTSSSSSSFSTRSNGRRADRLVWCWQQFGVSRPLRLGKKTQVCGFASNGRIDQVDSVFKISSRINSTWGGNLADMVRCARYLEIIEEEGLVDNARTVGEHLLARLSEMAEEFPGVVSNVRGRGLFVALDLPDKATRDRVLAACLEHGLMALASGASALRFRPALTLSREEAEEGVRKLRRALADTKG